MIDEKKLIEYLQSMPDGCNLFRWRSPKKIKEGLTRIIDRQLKIDEWIPCSERLPEVAGYEVLATVENPYGQRRIARVFTGYGSKPFWNCNDGFDLSVWKVMAWMPMPEPYKGGGI